MDDTTSITALGAASIEPTEGKISVGRRLCQLLRLCKRRVEDHRKDKLRQQLANEVFQAEKKRPSK